MVTGRHLEVVITGSEIGVTNATLTGFIAPIGIRAHQTIAKLYALGVDEGIGGVLEFDDMALAGGNWMSEGICSLFCGRICGVGLIQILAKAEDIGAISYDLFNHDWRGRFADWKFFRINGDDAPHGWKPKPAIMGFPAGGLLFAVGLGVFEAIGGAHSKGFNEALAAFCDSVQFGDLNAINSLKAAQPKITIVVGENAIDAIFKQTV